MPQSRASRSLHLGRLAGELIAGAVATGVGQLARGERPSWAGTLLTPGNAQRLTERLAQMRGAAMKVGQLMSMDGHGVLPAPFADLLLLQRKFVGTFMLCVRLGARLDLNAIFGGELDEAD